MKVLISAYNCLPNEGSEPGIGWNWAKHLANGGHEVVVLTRSTNRNAIDQECTKQSITNPRFLFFDLPWPVPRLYRLPFGNYVFYFLWQYFAANVAVAAHAKEKFDCVQHLTWTCFRLPSFMGRLKIPFIFGPVGGGEDTPKPLRSGLGWRGRLWDSLRRLVNRVSMLNPLVRSTFSAATTIAVTTDATLSMLPRAYRHKGIIQPSVGIDAPSIEGLARAANANRDERRRATLELLYVGRLLPWKGLHLGLKLVARARANGADIHLTIVGAGSDKTRLTKLAQTFEINDSVTWIPWIKRDDLLALYPHFDAFLFPSLHDSGGLAVLEAMTLGLPVVCLSLGGPGESVNDSCGKAFSTAGLDENSLVDAMVRFLEQIIEDPALLLRLSEGARARAARLTWRATVNQLYRTAFSLRGVLFEEESIR